MDILWEDPRRPLTGRNIADLLPDHAYTTVATVLDRLAHKGFVRRNTDGRVIEFAAISSRAAHTALVMHEALGANRESDEALVRFAETLSDSESEVLRQTLQRLHDKSRQTEQ